MSGHLPPRAEVEGSQITSEPDQTRARAPITDRRGEPRRSQIEERGRARQRARRSHLAEVEIADLNYNHGTNTARPPPRGVSLRLPAVSSLRSSPLAKSAGSLRSPRLQSSLAPVGARSLTRAMPPAPPVGYLITLLLHRCIWGLFWLVNSLAFYALERKLYALATSPVV